MPNFWKKLNKNFLAMAPMAGITDSPFRQMCKSHGADVLYSEMASATALFFDAKSRRYPVPPGLAVPRTSVFASPTLELLRFKEIERPYVVQLFGAKPEHFAQAAQIVEKLIKPDGIDINFGCPVNKVKKQGAGAVLMGNKKLAKEIIKATIENTNLPVSIKTRTKVNDVSVLEFLDYISDLDYKALMIHGRTLKQLFSGSIDTKIIKQAKNYFDGVIMANGGVGLADVRRQTSDVCSCVNEVLGETGVDGVGIARAAMGRPWIFEKARNGGEINLSLDKIYEQVKKHIDLIIEHKGEKGLIEFRKHLSWYVQGLPNAKKIRLELIQTSKKQEIISIFRKYLA